MQGNKAVFWLITAAYIIVSVVFVVIKIPSFHEEKLRLFFMDQTIPERVHAAIIEDHNGQTVLLTRLMHNKILFSLNNIFISLSRSTDPTYFYSFSNTFFFEAKRSLLPLAEFPLLLIAIITLIKKWHKIKKNYPFLLPMLLLSFIIIGLFLPYSASIKVIPLIVTLQLITAIGLYECLSLLPWLKKYFSA